MRINQQMQGDRQVKTTNILSTKATNELTNMIHSSVNTIKKLQQNVPENLEKI